MVNSNNLHLFILAILFYLLHVGNSEQNPDIIVVLERIDDCKSKSKWCFFRAGHSYATDFDILADPSVKLKFQQFTFKDGETNLPQIFRHYFCGINGLPDCEFLARDIVFVQGKLNLDS
ncbi:hypothetical protein MXB_3719, partial [Myxobolus squamalis]